VTSDPLLAWRSEFPILEKTRYLVSHSLGAMPRRAEEGLAEYARHSKERGVRAWAEGSCRSPPATRWAASSAPRPARW
jgi:kynureninase